MEDCRAEFSVRVISNFGDASTRIETVQFSLGALDRYSIGLEKSYLLLPCYDKENCVYSTSTCRQRQGTESLPTARVRVRNESRPSGWNSMAMPPRLHDWNKPSGRRSRFAARRRLSLSRRLRGTPLPHHQFALGLASDGNADSPLIRWCSVSGAVSAIAPTDGLAATGKVDSKLLSTL